MAHRDYVLTYGPILYFPLDARAGEEERCLITDALAVPSSTDGVRYATHENSGFGFDVGHRLNLDTPANTFNSLSSSTGFTISCWFRDTVATAEGRKHIFNMGVYGPTIFLYRFANTADISGYVGVTFIDQTFTTISRDVYSTYMFANSQWKHVAVTYAKSTGNLQIWLNGVQVLSNNIGTNKYPYPTLNTGLAYSTIGGPYFSSPNFSTNGKVDDVAMYDYPLSAGAIGNIFTSRFSNDLVTLPYDAHLNIKHTLGTATNPNYLRMILPESLNLGSPPLDIDLPNLYYKDDSITLTEDLHSNYSSAYCRYLYVEDNVVEYYWDDDSSDDDYDDAVTVLTINKFHYPSFVKKMNTQLSTTSTFAGSVFQQGDIDGPALTTARFDNTAEINYTWDGIQRQGLNTGNRFYTMDGQKIKMIHLCEEDFTVHEPTPPEPPIFTVTAVSTVTPIPAGDPYDANLPTNATGDLMLLYVDTEGNFLGNVAATDGWTGSGMGSTRSDSGYRGVSPHRKKSIGNEMTAEINTGWGAFSWTSLAAVINTDGVWNYDTDVVIGTGYSNQLSGVNIPLDFDYYVPDIWIITLLTKDLSGASINQSPSNPLQQAGRFTLTQIATVNPPPHPSLPGAQNPPGNFSMWSLIVGPDFNKLATFSLQILTAGASIRTIHVAGLGYNP